MTIEFRVGLIRDEDATDLFMECVSIWGRYYVPPSGLVRWRCQRCWTAYMVRWDAKSTPYRKYCEACTKKRERKRAKERRRERKAAGYVR